MFLCDYEEMHDTIEQSGLLQLLSQLRAFLVVLHIEKPGRGLRQGALKELPIVQSMLRPYSSEYFYLESQDPPITIARFAKEQQASLIITVRKRKGLFSHLFNTSFTRSLTVEMTIPLLVLYATKNYPVRKI